MDSLHVDAVKFEKANAIRRYRQLQKVTSLFRVIEICVILIIISKFSSQLPVLIKSSSVYFKDLSIILISPRVVFVVGNAIIITLFVISGYFSSKDSSSKNEGFNIIYEEFVEKSTRIGEDGIEKQRKKQSICEEKTVMVDTYTTTTTTTTVAAASDTKMYRRSKSEKLKSENSEKGRRVLRRTATECCSENMGYGEKSIVQSYAEDNLSNEEFKRTVEAFIARQQRFLREEEEYSAFV